MGATTAKDIYYTRDYEWVHFQQQFAYTGICRFKLTGFREIGKIIFPQPAPGWRKQGDLLAVIKSRDYQIEAYMPVDGELLQLNAGIIDDPMLLLKAPEGEGWIARIAPVQPIDHTKLMSPLQYQKQHCMRSDPMIKL